MKMQAKYVCLFHSFIWISTPLTDYSTVEGRHIIPIPKLKRKLKIQIKAGEWSGGEVNEEIELPKRIWSGRNTGVMFKVLFLDPGSESAKYEKEVPGSAGGDGKADAHRLG
jgi:hypothetical protein